VKKKFLPGKKQEKSETVATLPAGWDSAHAIRLGNKPFAELGANWEALSGSQVDSPCSLPSDPRIGPGNVAIVSKIGSFWGNAFRSKVGTLELRSTCVQSNRLRRDGQHA